MDYVNSLNAAEREKLKGAHVAVIGCGGTGGYVAELLIRLGVGKITAVDGDVFDETNLNRQLFCTAETIGKSKAQAVLKRAELIDPSVEVIAVSENITERNAADILSGCDAVIDALDSFAARKLVFEACVKLDIPMIFGAVGPWRVQVGVLKPSSRYLEGAVSPDFHGDSMLSFVPAMCAAAEVAEAVKLLTGNEPSLKGKILDIDLMTGETLEISI